MENKIKKDKELKNEKDKLAYAMFTDLSKIEHQYIPSDEELKIITEQTLCSVEDAKLFFHKNKGQLEETIFDFLESTDVIKKYNKVSLVSEDDLLNQNISTMDKMDTYRDILYHKDQVFQSKFDESSGLTTRTVDNFDYIPFNSSTKDYRKLKFKGSKEFFSIEIIRPYIQGELSDAEIYENSKKKYVYNSNKGGVELDNNDVQVSIDKSSDSNSNLAIENGTTEEVVKEEVKEEEVKEEEVKEEEVKEKKIILKTMLKDGLKIARKWGCHKPVLAFMEIDEKDKIEDNINKIATKFMLKSGHFDETQKIYGPAIMIDNWIL
jgi:hypothetical protein